MNSQELVLDVVNVHFFGVDIGQISMLGLVVIMLTMGLSLKPADFFSIGRDKKAVVAGLVAQLLLLPLLAGLLIYFLSPPPALAAGLIILACCPGGATSNFFSYLAKGNVALSVSLTAISGVIVLLTLAPLINFGFNVFEISIDQSGEIRLPVAASMLRIFLLLILPVAGGMLIGAKWPEQAVKYQALTTKISFAVIVFTMIVLIVHLHQELPTAISVAWPLTVSLNFSMMLIGVGLAKGLGLDNASARSIAIESGVQNYLLSVVIAVSMLKQTSFVLVPVVYLFTMYIGVFIFIAVSRYYDRQTIITLSETANSEHL